MAEFTVYLPLMFYLLSGNYYWDNPRKVGTSYTDENNVTMYEGPAMGITYFASFEEMKYKDFLKGGSAIFAFRFEGRIRNVLLLNLIFFPVLL